MRPRSVAALYQTTARVWLSAAALTLLLPVRVRLGLWLPLHLALAGAVSTAISGAMQNFVLSLTATPSPPEPVARSQFGLLTIGVVGVAVGFPTRTPWLVAAGGVAFVGAIALLGWILQRAWRLSLHRRHRMPLVAYACAIAAALVGATLGALMGAGAIEGEWYTHARNAHMTVNVLGWASLTVVGTLITLLPTVLRVRMPRWPGFAVLGLLVGGLLAQLLGWDLDAVPVLALGGVAYAAGAVGVILLVVRVARTERAWAIPAAGFHLMAGVVWFAIGSVGLVRALLDGASGFERYRPVFLTAFVGGWLLQVLLGAWAYLLPMARPGHPSDRRRTLAAFELLGPLQLALLNGGLALMALRAAGWVGDAAGVVGVGATLVGGGFALVKAWVFPTIARGPVMTDRARQVWGD